VQDGIDAYSPNGGRFDIKSPAMLEGTIKVLVWTSRWFSHDKMNFLPGLRFLMVLVGAVLCGSASAAPDAQWFRDAKFGIFIHWGLYSQLGNVWDGKSYYGSGEWIMNRAKIPAAQYARIAATFDPTNFNAGAWADFVRAAGARYLVVTAKHHEGFAMFGSKVSSFNIVDATPWHRDPMKALADSCRADGLKFGFYYSQFLDWHEADGGGNAWDFDKANKNYKRYYAAKSIPQIKELLSNYGPLGLMWFDMPGGLNRAETLAFMNQVRQLQPNCLISSRVGNGFGDFHDLGDSELPVGVIDGPWEALFTHNDSWGFVKNDTDFKSPEEILHLLASVAARGGNLILNVGPDGTGRIPDISQRYLRVVGGWLKENGDGIYATVRSPIPDQPWGVATLKPGRLYLHVFQQPKDGVLFVPAFSATAKRATFLVSGKKLKLQQTGPDLKVILPPKLPDSRDTVIVVDFTGTLRDAWQTAPEIISKQFDSFSVGAARTQTTGRAVLARKESSWYFGNWKHDTCVQNMQTPHDTATCSCRFLEPGDYRVILDYACPPADKDREGVVEVGGTSLNFESLLTGEYNSHEPLLFIHHRIGTVTIPSPETVTVAVHPKNDGGELFWLRRITFEPVE
jgi:alpha-L-fucosidase